MGYEHLVGTSLRHRIWTEVISYERIRECVSPPPDCLPLPCKHHRLVRRSTLFGARARHIDCQGLINTCPHTESLPHSFPEGAHWLQSLRGRYSADRIELFPRRGLSQPWLISITQIRFSLVLVGEGGGTKGGMKDVYRVGCVQSTRYSVLRGKPHRVRTFRILAFMFCVMSRLLR